jgi:uncharacterized protein YndB with AHSA1/START domain
LRPRPSAAPDLADTAASLGGEGTPAGREPGSSGGVARVHVVPSLVPRDADFIETAAELITTEVTVAGTPEEVWAVLIDNERWPEWFPAAKSCHTTSDQIGGVGSTRWIHVDLFKVNQRFVGWDPPHRWAQTNVDANLPGIVSVVEQAIVDPVGDHETRVTYTLGADFAPYMRPIVPVLRWRLGSLLKKGLAGIDGQVVKLRRESA